MTAGGSPRRRRSPLATAAFTALAVAALVAWARVNAVATVRLEAAKERFARDVVPVGAPASREANATERSVTAATPTRLPGFPGSGALGGHESAVEGAVEGASSDATEAFPRPVAAPPELELTVVIMQDDSPSELFPDVSVQFRNSTRGPVTVVRPGVDSFPGPYHWEFRDAATKSSIDVGCTLATCGSMTGPNDESFAVIAPSDAHRFRGPNLFPWIGFLPAGDYEVRLRYAPKGWSRTVRERFSERARQVAEWSAESAWTRLLIPRRGGTAGRPLLQLDDGRLMVNCDRGS